MADEVSDDQCPYGKNCRYLQNAQKETLVGLWANLLRVQHGQHVMRVFCMLECWYWHDQSEIPCTHAWDKTHNRDSCKFDHTFYREPSQQELTSLMQPQYMQMYYTTRLQSGHFFRPKTLVPVPQARPVAPQEMPSPQMVPVQQARSAAPQTMPPKEKVNEPPFPAPAGKYWEQTKSGWTLKPISGK